MRLTEDNVSNAFVAEMLAAERHVYELVKSHTSDGVVLRHPEAGLVLERLRDALKRHIDRLEEHLERHGGAPGGAGMKSTVSVLAAKVLALYEKLRSETASRMVRDDYAAVCLLTMSYTMLHSSALALHDQPTAELALEHLNELTPLVVELSRAVPYVVVNELADEFTLADRTVAPQASTRTHEAWASQRVGTLALDTTSTRRWSTESEL